MWWRSVREQREVYKNISGYFFQSISNELPVTTDNLEKHTLTGRFAALQHPIHAPPRIAVAKPI